MEYSDFTIQELKRKFGLVLDEDADLFKNVVEVPIPPILADILPRYLPLALNLSTEKARSELLVAPLLIEFKLLYRDRISLFSGFEFNVAEEDGLKGRCDYILARSSEQLALTSPVCILVEAKNENMIAGFPQCLAEMVAAARFNLANGEAAGPIYGAVTTGNLWRFLKLDGKRATIDSIEYNIQAPNKIFGILKHIAIG